MKKIKRINLKQYNELITIFNKGLNKSHTSLYELLFDDYFNLFGYDINNDGFGDIYTTFYNEPIIIKLELLCNYSKYIIETKYIDEVFCLLYKNKHVIKHAHWNINVYTKVEYTEYKIIKKKEDK